MKELDNSARSLSPEYNTTDSLNSSFHFNTKQWPIDLDLIFCEISKHSVLLPCLIAENVTKEQVATLTDQKLVRFLDFVESYSNDFQIYAVEMASREHEIWPGRLSLYLQTRYPFLESLGSSAVYYEDTLFLIPDASFCLARIEEILSFDSKDLNDCHNQLAPVLIVESIRSQTFNNVKEKFKKYFKIKGCRVGIIFDFNTVKTNLTLYKITRSQQQPDELSVTKSENGVIIIYGSELYPAGYMYSETPARELPNIVIDLKSNFYYLTWRHYYSGFTVDDAEHPTHN